MKRLLLTHQAIFNTSVNANAAIIATLPMSTFIADTEVGVLWVQYASATNAALQMSWTNLSTTIVVTPTYGQTGSTVTATLVMYNYYIPVMGDDSVLFSPSISGTVAQFLFGFIQDS